MPLSLAPKLQTPEILLFVTMLALKVRALPNLLKVSGSMDFTSKELPGTRHSVTSKTPRVKIFSILSLTLSSMLNAHLLNRRAPVRPRRQPSMRRTFTLARSTSTPFAKIDISSPNSTLSLSLLRKTRVRRELKAYPVSKMPWLINGALEEWHSSAKKNERERTTFYLTQ